MKKSRAATTKNYAKVYDNEMTGSYSDEKKFFHLIFSENFFRFKLMQINVYQPRGWPVYALNLRTNAKN